MRSDGITGRLIGELECQSLPGKRKGTGFLKICSLSSLRPVKQSIQGCTNHP